MLLREYAIQPEALADLSAIRFFLDQTGVSHGRMISRYPKKWLAMVYSACDACRPADKARIEIRLNNIKSKLISTGRPYDGNGTTWPENAIAEHAREPFTGVILSDTDPAARSETIVSASNVDEDCPCWQVSRDSVVDRTAADLCRPATTLLRMSREVVFVDRYFDGGGNHGRPLTAFLNEALTGVVPSRLEYHFDDRASKAHVLDRLRHMLRFLPSLDGIPLRFVRWTELPEADGLHPRYILTEHGGIKYDWGLGEDSGKTTDVLLLGPSDEIYVRRWSEYCAASTTFDFVDGFEILNGQVYHIDRDAGLFNNIGPA